MKKYNCYRAELYRIDGSLKAVQNYKRIEDANNSVSNNKKDLIRLNNITPCQEKYKIA